MLFHLGKKIKSEKKLLRHKVFVPIVLNRVCIKVG